MILETKNMDISVVLPIYNEAGNIETLVQEIKSALQPLKRTFEILCIDDGSKDNSAEVIQKLQKEFSEVVFLQHIRNFGQSAAQGTGFRYAKGQWIITLDSDGQNNPADMPKLLEHAGEFDCVCGVRKKRKDTWIRRISSKIANKVRNGITGDKVLDAGCTFRVMRKECLREIPIFNGMHRFIPTLLKWKGWKITEIEINHRDRVWGESKYGIRNRAWRGFVDCFALRWWKSRCFIQERCKI
ncbi:MAG TPA: glycosyltransferase family 2 protein [Planctomycetota bacterium]|nr:glycosyltransferase family 2 protein [Planctomycetota bacterium]HRU52102.1 glycosyltransferase family 2 protein [Planctomycetota bacterium]